MSQWTEDGARYRRARRAFLAANPVCWLCHHGGADQVDHVIPRSVMRTKLDYANWRPAHGTRGCDQCPRDAYGRLRKCNQVKGNRPHTHVDVLHVPKLDW